MNLYKLHSNPKELHNHNTPFSNHISTMSELYRNMYRDPEDYKKSGAFIDYVNKNIKDSSLSQAFSKLLVTEFREWAVWIIFQLSDTTLENMLTIPELKKRKSDIAISSDMSEKIKNNKTLRTIFNKYE